MLVGQPPVSSKGDGTHGHDMDSDWRNNQILFASAGMLQSENAWQQSSWAAEAVVSEKLCTQRRTKCKAHPQNDD